MKKIAVVFLCKEPHEETIRFAKQIKSETNFFVSIVSDKYSNSNSLYISDEYCKEKGYINSNISNNATHIKKNPIVWDKFLCLYSETDFDFVWVFEDDCFIPSVETLVRLNEKYNGYDLVVPNNFSNPSQKAQDWHWRNIYDKIEPPYHYSMVCACGMSKKMLQTIKKYVDENKTLFYIEVMFNTLAMQNNLKVIDVFELKSIVWLGDWWIDEFLLLPNNIFHPLKDISNHEEYRIKIKESIENGYKPVNNLPEFLL